MSKSRMVKVRAATLRKILDRVNETTKTHCAIYSRSTKTWPWSDALYYLADPYEFALYDELRKALTPPRGQTP